MANLIGPSFYAGFLDIGLLPDWERRAIRTVGMVVAAGRRFAAFLRRRFVDVGLGFYETTFLTMQRKIFEDQALMHEAFLGGGVAAIDEIGEAGIIDRATVLAWHRISAGGRADVEDGNRTLLFREQHDIIERFYEDMRAYTPPWGRLFTHALTLAGSPAVPGAKAYAEVFPVTFAVSTGGRALILDTPFPEGNIAVFADRWHLIERDTLPAYDRFVTGDASRAQAMIETPLDERVMRFRLLRRIGAIVLGLATRWRLRVGARMPLRRFRIIRTRIAGARPAGTVAVDLKLPPERADAWTQPRGTFALAVSLPDGRCFTADARSAVLVAQDQGGRPTRLVVKLAATDFEAARSTLVALAGKWGADRGAIDGWASAAARVTADDHAYSTRVFPARSVEFVRLEFQVEHHVSEGDYVIDVLFSWDEKAKGVSR